MCFSASISFGTAAVLGILWVIILSKIKTREEFFLSFVPLFFALQQFAEGMIWIGNSFTQYFAYFFLLVATVVWPSYVPFTILQLEKKTERKTKRKRKKWLKIFLFAGGFLSIILAVFLILGAPKPNLSEEGIQYLRLFVLGNIPFLEYFLLAIYVFVVVGSCWLSSLKVIRILGGGLLIALLLSFALSFTTYGSRWCYFAAVFSAIIAVYFLVKRRPNI